jgi:hypothetical protein
MLLTLERCQALSMTAFYPLDHVAFFARQGILPASLALTFGGRKFGSVDLKKWGMYSCRCWAAYVVLQLVHLREDWDLLKRSASRGKESAGRNGDDDGLAWQKDLARRKKALINELIVNLGNLPVAVHWYVVNWLRILGWSDCYHIGLELPWANAALLQVTAQRVLY